MNKRRYPNSSRSLGKGLLTFMIVVALAIGAGYGLTEYVITPLFLGTDSEEPQGGGDSQQEFNGSSIIIDQQDVNTDGEETSGPAGEVPSPPEQETGGDSAPTLLYCVQYGSFSDLAGAEAAASTLAASNIAVAVIQKDGAYKLIGSPYITKEEAKSSLESAKAVAGDDLFVTTVEVRME